MLPLISRDTLKIHFCSKDNLRDTLLIIPT